MKLLYNSFCLTVHLSGVPQSVHLMLLEKFNFKTRYLKKIADIIEILNSNLHLKNNLLGLSLMLPKTNIYIYILKVLWFSVFCSRSLFLFFIYFYGNICSMTLSISCTYECYHPCREYFSYLNYPSMKIILVLSHILNEDMVILLIYNIGIFCSLLVSHSLSVYVVCVCVSVCLCVW